MKMKNNNRIYRMIVSVLCAVSIIVGQTNNIHAESVDNNSNSTMIGTVNMEGSRNFDCDTLKNSDSDQWRWISYPGSRMVMNFQARATETATYDGGMNLNMAVLANGIDTKRQLQKIQMGPKDGSVGDYQSLNVAWYPYKLTADATYSKGKVHMDEFFADKDTFIRIMNITEAKDAKMQMTGRREGMSLSGNNLIFDEEKTWMVFKFLKLNEQGQVIGQYTPIVEGTDWYVTDIFENDNQKIAFSLTLLPKNVDGNSAESILKLADETVGIGTNINELLSETKKLWDEKLGKVPAPENFGLSGNQSNGNISAEKHRKSFYAAWAFQYQNIVEPTPEKGYNYYQVTLGKASTWGSGSASAPNSCSWESLFNIQELSYVEPEIAWDAMKGFIYSIDDNGILDGECLPSQKAHTTWLCYSNMIKEFPEREEELNSELNSLYSYIYKYLMWRAENPRWIYGNENFKNEKDISFVTQWYSDVNYAIKIAEKLGKYNDVATYERMKTAMGENARKWFFAEYDTSKPDSRENRIKAFCFLNDDGTNSYSWSGSSHNAASDDALNYVYEALFAEFPKDLTDKLVHSYLAFTGGHEEEPLLGFQFYKYGDGCHTAYGLMEKELQYPELAGKWKLYVDAVLANAIKNVDFAECLRVSGNSTHLEGVEPSSFTASAVIDYTYMENGMRIDLGEPVAIGGDNLSKTSSTDVELYTIKGSRPSLPKTVTVSNAQGEKQEALAIWPEIKESEYNGSKRKFTVEGTVYGTDIKVNATVYVYSNVALGKNASAGSEGQENNAQKAVDGDLSTRWGDAAWSNEHWYQVDLGQRYNLNSIAIAFEASYAKDFEIKVSDDGNNWKTMKTVTGNEQLDWNLTFDKPVYASYVRIDATKTSNEEWGFSIWEFEVYGKEETVMISGDIDITGYQMTSSLNYIDGNMGFRVIYQVEPTVDGQTYEEAGLVYGLASGENPISKDDVIYGFDSEFVKSYVATENGKLSKGMGDSQTASYYVRTMSCGVADGSDNISTNAYTTKYYVRAYVRLSNGDIIYSDVKSFTIYNVADFLYQNQLVSQKSAYDCLYKKILKYVNNDYKERDFDWSKVIIKDI